MRGSPGMQVPEQKDQTPTMGFLKDFLKKQFIDVIHYTETEPGILATRYPMQDMEIQNGAKLTVRESQMAVFVNEGRIADAFGPGLYTLNTQTLPLLTNIMNWDKMFQSPFKSDVYFFSTRVQTNQKWGTANPITIRDKEFGAVRLRGYGIYSWHVADPRVFHAKISGTQETYRVADIEGQLRNSIVGWISDTFAESGVPFLDMAANQVEMGKKVSEFIKPHFAEMGLALDSFVVENLSLPEELQKMLDTRIGMNMIGDMNRYTQYQVANSMPIAAANEGGVAGVGAGLGAGFGMAQAMMGAMNQAYAQPGAVPPGGAPPPGGMPAQGMPQPMAAPVPPVAPVATPTGDTKFCINCGTKLPSAAKFCFSCGQAQG
jgi:membrane protease subunit (stomatin/prohibitin family)